MKLIEILTTLAAFSAAAALLFAPQLGAGRAPAIALAAAAVVLGVMLHISGPLRWQMLPAEALILAVVVMLALGAQPDGAARMIGAIVAIVATGLAAVLATGFPVAKLPAPGGPYAVGATTLELARPASGEGEADRLLSIKIWHPAQDPLEAASEPLWSEMRAPAMPAPLRFFLGYLAAVETHTRAGAPVRADRAPFPVVIYNHALVSIPSENTLLMEALSSAGFIVVSVSHKDQAAEQAALQAAVPSEERARDQALYAAWRNATDRAERARLMAEIYANSSAAAEIVRRRTADTAFVVDRIETVLSAIPGAAGARFADLDRVGAVGFSLGGAVATRWCMTDRRCIAAVNLDGGAFGVPADGPLRVPYLMIYAEATEGANDGLRARADAPFEEETLVGARHMDFTDATLLWPLMKRLGVLGPGSGAELVRRKNERVTAFLDARLR